MTGAQAQEKQGVEIAGDTLRARKAMIDSQLRTSGVNEEFVLARMMSVPREDFLPEDKRQLAYIDRSVAVEGGALASPLFYGKVLLEAVPNADDAVLVVDGGTGYLSALIQPLVENTIVRGSFGIEASSAAPTSMMGASSKFARRRPSSVDGSNTLRASFSSFFTLVH